MLEHALTRAVRHQTHLLVTLFYVPILISGLLGCPSNGEHEKEMPKPVGKASPFVPASITMREYEVDNQKDLWELQDDKLLFVDPNGIEWVAPRGTLTDGASIHRLALAITDDRHSSEFFKAAVLHDAYCADANRNLPQWRKKSPQEVHRMFYDAMIAGRTDPEKAGLMYAAVLLGGPKWPPEDPQKVSVDAVISAYISTRTWIKKTKRSPEEIKAYIAKKEPVLKQLDKLNIQASLALENKQVDEASKFLLEQETLLTKELAKSPSDSMLLNFKGDLHKNRAKLHSMSGNRKDKERQELMKSEKAFTTILNSEPRDPNALTGLGSVSMMRGNTDKAENYTRRALEIAPELELEGAKRELRTFTR